MGSGLPWSLARQHASLMTGFLRMDGLSVLLLAALALQLVAVGSALWSPAMAGVAVGAVVVSMGNDIFWVAVFVVATGAVHVLQARRGKGWWVGCLAVGVAAATLIGSLLLYLSGNNGSFDQVGAAAMTPGLWILIFGACWVLLGIWPASYLVPGLDPPTYGVLRIAAAGLLLRTFNLGPWPPVVSLGATVAAVLAALLGALTTRENLPQVLPGAYMLAILPLGGPLGPAAAMSCTLLDAVWIRKPKASRTGGLVIGVAWTLTALVPLWIVTVTAHQAGISAAAVGLLVVGILALRSVPDEAFRPSDVIFFLVPLTFPLAWQYLVAPAVDALYQGLGPMFVTADPWVGVFFPSGDWVLTVLPYPALSIAVPALLVILVVVAAIAPLLELHR